MKKCVSAFLVLLLMSGICAAAGMPEFSADSVMKAKGKVMESKIYISKDKIRTEASGMINIVRTDKNISWSLMPGQKMYMEPKFSPDKNVGTSDKMPGEYSRVKLGKESVNGITCAKYKVSYKTNGKKEESYQWMSDDGIPMKTAAIDGSWSTEYKNVKKGKIDPALFELPKGYKKFSMPTF
jgi:hypothetical protein